MRSWRNWFSPTYEADQRLIGDLHDRVASLAAEKKQFQELLEAERAAHTQTLKQTSNWLAAHSSPLSPFPDVPRDQQKLDPPVAAPDRPRPREKVRLSRQEFDEQMKKVSKVTPATRWNQARRSHQAPPKKEVVANGADAASTP